MNKKLIIVGLLLLHPFLAANCGAQELATSNKPLMADYHSFVQDFKTWEPSKKVAEYKRLESVLIAACETQKDGEICFAAGSLIKTYWQHIPGNEEFYYGDEYSVHFYVPACKAGNQNACETFDSALTFKKAEVIVAICANYGGLGRNQVHLEGEYVFDIEIEVNIKKNYDQVLKAACSTYSFAPAEAYSIIPVIYGMKTGTITKHFNLCDHATSGVLWGHCEQRNSDRELAFIRKRLETLSKGFTQEQLEALGNLQTLARKYFEVAAETSYNGGCLAGSGASALQIRFELIRHRALLEQLTQFIKPHKRTSSQASRDKAQARFDQAWRTEIALRKQHNCDKIEVDRSQTATQMAWINFRDQYITFYELLWGAQASAEELRWHLETTLLLQRIRDL